MHGEGDNIISGNIILPHYYSTYFYKIIRYYSFIFKNLLLRKVKPFSHIFHYEVCAMRSYILFATGDKLSFYFFIFLMRLL